MNAWRYEQVAVSGKLAAALRAFSRYLDGVPLRDPEIDRLVDHLWQWLTVDASTFRQWDQYKSEMQSVGLGDPMPERFLNRPDLDVTDLRTALENLVEIVHSCLFAAVTHEPQLHLVRLEEVLAKYGVELESPSLFGAPPVTEKHGWGRTLDSEEVRRWQNLPTPAAAIR